MLNMGRGYIVKKIIIMVIIIFTFVILILLYMRQSRVTEHKFSKDVAPYDKSMEEEKNFNTNEELSLNVNTCNIKVLQKDCKEIQVKIIKAVGDEKEENLQSALDSFKCEMEENKLTIGFPDDIDSVVNSTYASVEIALPRMVKKFILQSSNSDIRIEGSYQKMDLTSNIGDITLKLTDLAPDSSFYFSGENGDINIMVPKDSKLNLKGASDIKIDKDIQTSEEGTEMKFHRTISDIKIDKIGR